MTPANRVCNPKKCVGRVVPRYQYPRLGSLPVLLLPLTVPVLIASVKATAVALGAQSVEPLPWLQLLLAFDVIMVATSFLVFEYILDE